MLPLLTFASGLVAGIVGIRLLKTVKTPENLKTAAGTIGDKARHGLDQAQSGLRQATVSGLTAIEKSSATLRARLSPEMGEPPVEQPARPAARKATRGKAKAVAEEGAAIPARKRSARKPAAAKTAPETGSES